MNDYLTNGVNFFPRKATATSTKKKQFQFQQQQQSSTSSSFRVLPRYLLSHLHSVQCTDPSNEGFFQRVKHDSLVSDFLDKRPKDAFTYKQAQAPERFSATPNRFSNFSPRLTGFLTKRSKSVNSNTRREQQSSPAKTEKTMQSTEITEIPKVDQVPSRMASRTMTSMGFFTKNFSLNQQHHEKNSTPVPSHFDSKESKTTSNNCLLRLGAKNRELEKQANFHPTFYDSSFHRLAHHFGKQKYYPQLELTEDDHLPAVNSTSGKRMPLGILNAELANKQKQKPQGDGKRKSKQDNDNSNHEAKKENKNDPFFKSKSNDKRRDKDESRLSDESSRSSLSNRTDKTDVDVDEEEEVDANQKKKKSKGEGDKGEAAEKEEDEMNSEDEAKQKAGVPIQRKSKSKNPEDDLDSDTMSPRSYDIRLKSRQAKDRFEKMVRQTLEQEKLENKLKKREKISQDKSQSHQPPKSRSDFLRKQQIEIWMKSRGGKKSPSDSSSGSSVILNRSNEASSYVRLIKQEQSSSPVKRNASPPSGGSIIDTAQATSSHLNNSIYKSTDFINRILNLTTRSTSLQNQHATNNNNSSSVFNFVENPSRFAKSKNAASDSFFKKQTQMNKNESGTSLFSASSINHHHVLINHAHLDPLMEGRQRVQSELQRHPSQVRPRSSIRITEPILSGTDADFEELIGLNNNQNHMSSYSRRKLKSKSTRGVTNLELLGNLQSQQQLHVQERINLQPASRDVINSFTDALAKISGADDAIVVPPASATTVVVMPVVNPAQGATGIEHQYGGIGSEQTIRNICQQNSELKKPRRGSRFYSGADTTNSNAQVSAYASANAQLRINNVISHDIIYGLEEIIKELNKGKMNLEGGQTVKNRTKKIEIPIEEEEDHEHENQ